MPYHPQRLLLQFLMETIIALIGRVILPSVLNFGTKGIEDGRYA